MAGIALLSPQNQWFDDDGNPVAGGLLYSFLSGTATPTPTYSAPTISVPNQNANPLELDSAGRGVVYVDNTLSIKLILKTSAGATVWTRDLIPSAAVGP